MSGHTSAITPKSSSTCGTVKNGSWSRSARRVRVYDMGPPGAGGCTPEVEYMSRRSSVSQASMPSSRAISIRWTSLVPSPISRILESRHIRATGYSFMNP